MGNEKSKFAERAEFVDDLNTVHCNYLGGEGYKYMEYAEDCPTDRLILAHCND